ncbi:MAG: hypothetical protein SWH78_05515 [Thermodesulfobacteriota bacterium]|nr:hypothetical protein [Thermodesulfobacteriota bacterium]
MRPAGNAHTRLTEALVAAYREKEKVQVDAKWETSVMSHIRRLGPIHSQGVSLQVFERYVWRFAFTTCLLILILTAASIRGEFNPEYEIARVFMEEPTRLSLLAFLTP